MDHFSALACDLVKAVCGRRSTSVLARRLGYRSNVIYRWERGLRFPTSAEFFGLCALVRIDVRKSLERFDHNALEIGGRGLRQGKVSAFLRALASAQSIAELAAAADRSRFVVSRILSGATEPRLPDVLRMIEAASGRVLDFIGSFVEPEKLPSARAGWAKLQAYRRLAYNHPLSEAVLAVIELRDYAALPAHKPGFIAERLQITLEEEEHTLNALATAGVLMFRDGRWLPPEGRRFVDTRAEPEAFRHLKRFWSKHAAERLARDDQNLCAYAVFSVSQAELNRLTDLYLEYFESARRLMRESPDAERAMLMTIQFTTLDGRAVLPDARPAARDKNPTSRKRRRA